MHIYERTPPFVYIIQVISKYEYRLRPIYNKWQLSVVFVNSAVFLINDLYPRVCMRVHFHRLSGYVIHSSALFTDLIFFPCFLFDARSEQKSR